MSSQGGQPRFDEGDLLPPDVAAWGSQLLLVS
jgi:hypothetical protein